MNNFQPLGTRRLYRQIAEQIRDLLASGQYPLGSRLPPERDMAAQLKVSRTSVREAIIALELAGLVDVRIGSGIYVSRVPAAGQALFEAGDTGPGPFEILNARRIVEGEVAAEAAESIEPAMVAALGQILESMERAEPGSQADEESDRRFHIGIAEATHNGALVQTVRMYWDMRRGPMWRKLERHFQTPALRDAVLGDHREVWKALSQRSPAEARKAMHRHLRRVEREFTQSVEPEAAAEGKTDVADNGATPRPGDSGPHRTDSARVLQPLRNVPTRP